MCHFSSRYWNLLSNYFLVKLKSEGDMLQTHLLKASKSRKKKKRNVTRVRWCEHPQSKELVDVGRTVIMGTLGLPKFLILKALINIFTDRCPKQKADGTLGRLVLSLRVQVLTALQNPFKAPFGTHPIKYMKNCITSKNSYLYSTITLQYYFS